MELDSDKLADPMQKCGYIGIGSILDWMVQWLTLRQWMSMYPLMERAKPYMMSRSMPNGNVLADFVDIAEVVAKHTSGLKLSAVEVYEAVMCLDDRQGYYCLGAKRC